jgi:hypothetical protein
MTTAGEGRTGDSSNLISCKIAGPPLQSAGAFSLPGVGYLLCLANGAFQRVLLPLTLPIAA